MNITNDERELLERALDELHELCRYHCDNGPELARATGLYLRSISVVRDRPEGERRVRSDFMTKRPTPQGEMPV
jgi:hypothetical protein